MFSHDGAAPHTQPSRWKPALLEPVCAGPLDIIQKIDKSKFLWILLIILASLVEYSSMIMVLVVYSLLRIFNLKFNKKDILRLVKDFFIISALLLSTLYLMGYFEVRFADTLGVGFGNYKLNLLSIFDPVNSFVGISWSWFLPDIKLSKAEELEGFNYLGLGQILLLLFAFFLFINKKYKIISRFCFSKMYVNFCQALYFGNTGISYFPVNYTR